MSSGIRTNTFTPLDNLRMPVQLTCMSSVTFVVLFLLYLFTSQVVFCPPYIDGGFTSSDSETEARHHQTEEPNISWIY